MIRINATALLVVLCFSGAAAGEEIEVSVGPMVSNLAPVDIDYENRFLTPGTSVGLAVDVDAPGILDFRITGEYFWKNSSPTGWDGEVSAVLVSVMPLVEHELFRRFQVFAGAGGVYISGKYSGTDDFGEYVEVEGSSAGFILSFGAEVTLAGPIAGRLEYRRSFAGFKTDNAVIDGQESSVYPAAEADLGSSQFCITFPVSLFGGQESIF
jgi:opacity protein-like surface antigen